MLLSNGVIALLGPGWGSRNVVEFDVYTKTVDGRDVQERVEVYVIHGMLELVEAEVDSGELCCALAKGKMTHQNDKGRCIA